jgi:hypothetical protein
MLRWPPPTSGIMNLGIVSVRTAPLPRQCNEVSSEQSVHVVMRLGKSVSSEVGATDYPDNFVSTSHHPSTNELHAGYMTQETTRTRSDGPPQAREEGWHG